MNYKVHTIQELREWTFPGKSLAIIGHPIAHSKSPCLYNAAFKYLATENPDYKNWRYFKFDIKPEELEEALQFFHKKHFIGLNVTIPHKISILDYVDDLDESNQFLGAINTLVRTPNNFKAYNTDGHGVKTAAEKMINGPLQRQTIILLGAGGAATSAALQCLRSNCKELWVGNRSRHNLEILLTKLKSLFPDSAIRGFDIAQPPLGIPQEGILINATSLGLKPTDPMPIDLNLFNHRTLVLDMNYNDESPALVKEAKKQGKTACDGKIMLTEQAIRPIKLWTDKEVPTQVLLDAIQPKFNP